MRARRAAPRSPMVGFVRFVLAAVLLAPSLCLAAPGDDRAGELHAAAKAGDTQKIVQLLAEGVDVDAPSRYGATALSFAAQKGKADVVRLLLDNKATVDAKDTFYESTPLSWAAGGGHADVVRHLFDSGAKGAKEALARACGGNHAETVEVILELAKPDPDELTDVLLGNPDFKQPIKQLLRAAGADGNRQPAVLLDETQLQACAGTFASESGTLYRVVVDGPRLQLRFGKHLAHVMEPRSQREFCPVGKDRPRFSFRAGDDGHAGFDMETKARTVHFERVEAVAENVPAVAANDEPAVAVEQATNWPSFRGPGASGIADGQHPPINWNVKTGVNVRWKTPIPGLGHSCPVVWGDQLFLTTSTSGGGDHSLRTGQYGDVDSVEDETEHSWMVYCLDRRTGSILWNRTACRGVPQVKRHLKSTHANPTVATDGRFVVACFGSEGLFCFDLEGHLVWRKNLGDLASGWFYDDSYEWGFGSSPIVFASQVIVQCDVGKESFIAAYRIEDGQLAWRTPREEIPSWGTPTVCQGPAGPELVTCATNFVRAYDPTSGEELWRLARLSEVSIPTPISAEGLIFVTSGYKDIKPIYAIRAGARGDITLADDQSSNEAVAWRQKSGGPYIPTPIVYRGHLYACSNSGVLACYDALTGERLYRKRLGGAGGYTASPVAADGRLYFLSEEGDAQVVRAGAKFELLGRNELGEACMSTPAISAGMLYIRTQHHLYGLGRPPTEPSLE